MDKEILKIKEEEKRIEEETEKIAAALAEEDFFSYIALMWRYARTSKEFSPEWYVEAMADHLTALYKGEIKKLAISLSPRHGKSTICNVLFPTWVWIQDASIDFLTAAYGKDLALRDAAAARDLINSNLYQKYWGSVYSLKEDQNKKDEYITSKGGKRLTTSVEGRGTGDGCDILIIDDPHKAKDKRSETKLRNTIDWYFGTIRSRYNDPAEWRQLVIHQRLAEGDLIGTLLEAENDWELLAFPEEYEGDKRVTSLGFRDPRRVKGELLAPNIFNEKAAEVAKKDIITWETQYQQNPGVKGKGLLKESSVLRYSTPIDYGEFRNTVLSIDCASGGETENRSYSVFQLWGQIGKKKYLIDSVREFMDFTGEQSTAIEMLNKWSPNYTLIEKKANGKALIDVLVVKGYAGIIGVNPTEYGDKIQRFASVIPEFDAKEVFIPSRDIKSWVKELEEEILSFPRSKYKDQADALSQALIWYKTNSVIIRRTEENKVVGIKGESMWRREWNILGGMVSNREELEESIENESPRNWFN